MTNFRLKNNAIEFFPPHLSLVVEKLEFWNQKNVPIEALEEINGPYIEFGHVHLDSLNSRALCGQGFGKGSHFHFTIKFPNDDYTRYSKRKDNKVIKKIMSKIQSVLDETNFIISPKTEK